MVDLAVLVARDHIHFEHAISLLVEPSPSREERRSALEAARVGLATHADGEAKVLHEALAHVAAPQDFAGLVAQVLAAHRTQESILRRLDHEAERGAWVCSLVRLRRSLSLHADHEQVIVMTALRRCLPAAEYERLAGAYAAEKMRALGLMRSLLPSHARRDRAKSNPG